MRIRTSGRVRQFLQTAAGLVPAVKVPDPRIRHCGYRYEHYGKSGIVPFFKYMQIPCDADKVFFNFRRGTDFFEKGYFFVSISKLRGHGGFEHGKREVFHSHVDAEMVALGQGFADAVERGV